MDAQTRSVWLLGDPVAHSRSPALHNPVYQEMGLNWVYLASRVTSDRLAEALKALDTLGAVGANVTVPHKQAIVPYLDSVTPTAQAIGAVNTIRRTAGGWEGHNTDGEGWLASWDEEIGQPLSGRRILIVGAGGAARSVLWAVSSRGAKDIVVLNRSPQRAVALGRATASLESFSQALRPACVVINTTSVGMWPEVDHTPVKWPSQLDEGVVTCDLIYNPRPTLFLRQASALGAATLDGAGMLIHQAAQAIRYWSGRQDIPVDTMRSLL